MDANVEDKIVHQIEKNLSNNINENLFGTGRMLVEDKKQAEHNNSVMEDSAKLRESRFGLVERDKEVTEVSVPQLSRAEYIRQAREACLRQMNATPAVLRGAGNAIEENELLHPALSAKKKLKEDQLLIKHVDEEDSTLEAAAYRSLMIRTVCAVMIFLSIFLIDKFKLKFGDFSFKTVEELVRGKDSLAALEDLIVSWLK